MTYTTQANVVLYGLDQKLSYELAHALSNVCDGLHTEALANSGHCLATLATERVDLLFCGPDTELVRTLRASNPKASIVVVSRLPEVMDWLDAIEAGADDYCAPPFEPMQIRWILDANL